MPTGGSPVPTLTNGPVVDAWVHEARTEEGTVTATAQVVLTGAARTARPGDGDGGGAP